MSVEDDTPEGETLERARGIRIFATWMRDEQGPMFCRWIEPGRRAADDKDRG